MREIKFRAYDANASVMRDWPWCYTNLPMTSLSTEEDGLFKQQFTGTTDINGTEIFDQDIVKARGNRDPEIVSMHRGMWVVGDGLTPPILWKWRPYDIEIIGNIHENPELLK